jgi:hypothetical protein
LGQRSVLLKSSYRGWIRRVLIHIDDTRYEIGGKAEHLLEEALRRTRIALGDEQKINRLASRIYRSIEVLLLPFTLMYVSSTR